MLTAWATDVVDELLDVCVPELEVVVDVELLDTALEVVLVVRLVEVVESEPMVDDEVVEIVPVPVGPGELNPEAKK